MRINALRRELTETIGKACALRPPALRRSREEDWLYATDLPILFDGTVPDEAGRSLKALGWEYAPEREWLQIRKEAPEPPEDWFTGLFGKEAACCLSLLDRHAVQAGRDAATAQYRLIKAGEEGDRAYEAACAIIHREWAERLRQGLPLPAIDRRYFGG